MFYIFFFYTLYPFGPIFTPEHSIAHTHSQTLNIFSCLDVHSWRRGPWISVKGGLKLLWSLITFLLNSNMDFHISYRKWVFSVFQDYLLSCRGGSHRLNSHQQKTRKFFLPQLGLYIFFEFTFLLNTDRFFLNKYPKPMSFTVISFQFIIFSSHVSLQTLEREER